MCRVLSSVLIFVTRLFFFFNDTATTEIYTLSLHDALPIWGLAARLHAGAPEGAAAGAAEGGAAVPAELSQALQHIEQQLQRSEEHTSELQSLAYLVCRLLLEKKKLKIHRAKSYYSSSRNGQ